MSIKTVTYKMFRFAHRQHIITQDITYNYSRSRSNKCERKPVTNKLKRKIKHAN